MVIFLYILKCKDNSYYVGVTNNVERRILEHNLGENPRSYTYKRRPVELVFHESFSDPYVAFQRETQIKGWSRKKKEALINGDFDNLVALSKSSLQQVKDAQVGGDTKDPSTSSG